MEMKEYMTPEMEVVNVEYQNSLLSTSGGEAVPPEEGKEPDPGQSF